MTRALSLHSVADGRKSGFCPERAYPVRQSRLRDSLPHKRRSHRRNDQPAWARRLYELGVGASPVPRRVLTAEKLAMMGQWRVEVSPRRAQTDDVFLHVIQVGDNKLQAMENAELIEALRHLAEREQRIHRVTRDLQMGKNQ